MEGEPPKRPAQDWGDFVDTGRKWQAIAISLIVILILVAAGGAWYIKHKDKTQKQAKTTTTAVQQPTTKISSQTKSYSSPNFYLSLNYPNDWVLTDSGGGVMTIVSPAISLTNSSGQAVKGQITVTFRNSSQALPEFDKGNAVATLDSQKIAYTNPTQGQRANTYVSFLTYAGSTSSGIDEIFITSDNGYKSGQAIPKTDITKVDPKVSITFTKCADSSCVGKGAPMGLSTNAWKDTQISDPLLKILESLSIT